MRLKCACMVHWFEGLLISVCKLWPDGYGATSFNTRVLIATLQCSTLLKEFVTCMDINSYIDALVTNRHLENVCPKVSLATYFRDLTKCVDCAGVLINRFHCMS